MFSTFSEREVIVREACKSLIKYMIEAGAQINTNSSWHNTYSNNLYADSNYQNTNSNYQNQIH